jgi:hypothetical protein
MRSPRLAQRRHQICWPCPLTCRRPGHNGAGAAELAAARLHVLLAAHPALRMHTGELGPPAVARAEEVAIASALRSAFGQVDEATLAVARREGVRDGATALVVLRLGQVRALRQPRGAGQHCD